MEFRIHNAKFPNATGYTRIETFENKFLFFFVRSSKQNGLIYTQL